MHIYHYALYEVCAVRRLESRFQRWRFGVARIPGALPQAAYERRAFGARHILSLCSASEWTVADRWC